MNNQFIQFSMTARKMNFLCWTMLIGPALLYLVVNILYSGIDGFWDNFINIETLYFLPILIILYIVHEALHVLAGLIVGTRLSSFKFGFDKTSLSIECYCQDEMSIKAYQFMLLLPFVVLTPLLVGLACFNASHLWWIMLVISTSGCAFDLTISMGLFGVPVHTRIIPELKGENGYVYLKAAN